MKKIFSKFTRERDEKFQIETAILLKDQKKYAVKRPLTEKAAAHVQEMMENSRYYREKGINLLADCTLAGEFFADDTADFAQSVVFPFVEGDTYYNLFLNALKNKRMQEAEEILAHYREVLNNSCPDGTNAFADSAQSVEIFGELPLMKGMAAAGKLDLDLTLDNLIRTEKGDVVIDYEWIFDFPLPVDFVLYRAVLALYVRNGEEMNSFSEMEKLLEGMGISAEQQRVFGEMNEAFNRYVKGEHSSDIPSAYEIQPHVLSGWIEGKSVHAQIFFGNDPGFAQCSSMDQALGAEPREASLEADLSKMGDVRVIRIDPLDIPGVVWDFHLCWEQDGEWKEADTAAFRHNALTSQGGRYVFIGEDPQIIWDLPKDVQPQKIRVSYKTEVRTGMEHRDNNLLLLAGEEMERMKRELAEKTARLAYIEHTLVYKSLLDKKVKKVFEGEKS